LRSRRVYSNSRTSQHFMEPEGSLPCPQEPSTGPQPEPDQSNPYNLNVRWVPCHHGMARPQVADVGDALQVWRVAANILNKQSRTAEKWWSFNLGVGRGANNSSPSKISLLRKITRSLGPGRFPWINDLSESSKQR
jgi:hypothetical protein